MSKSFIPFSVIDPLQLVSQKNSVVEATLGSRLVLNCTVSGSSLQGVKWYRDASMVQDFPQTSSALTQFEINKVQIADLGVYQCFAYNSNDNVNGRIQVVLTGRYT